MGVRRSCWPPGMAGSDLVARLWPPVPMQMRPIKMAVPPIMFAAISGDPETIRLLLSHGASVNAVANFGWTALMVAAVKGRAQTARELLLNGADLNAVDAYGWTR